MRRRAIGIVRVSAVAGREGASFASPGQQRDRITSACARDGMSLLRTIDELDVSGGTPLAKRAGLRAAVEAIEAQEADILIVAYFDRLVRSLTVQREVVDRVEAAGGQVVALDVGEVSAATAARWLSGTLLGAMNEYQRRSTAERTRGAQERAIDRGVAPYPNVTPGYQRAEDGRYVPSEHAPAVREAFEMRARGEYVSTVRAHLAAHGITLSYHGVCHLLQSRVVLGELHFGDLQNLTAHEAIVPVDVWAAVQRVKTPRGRPAQSERLLARLGVLQCGTCGSLMVIGAQNRWPFYRCNRVREDCPRRVSIAVDLAETAVSDAVRAHLADLEGRASAAASVERAVDTLTRAQADLDSAIRTLSVVGDEPATVQRLTELRDARDQAQADVDRLGGLAVALRINVAEHWDRLTLDERRGLIRANVRRAVVHPGRGAGRVSVELFGE